LAFKVVEDYNTLVFSYCKFINVAGKNMVFNSIEVRIEIDVKRSRWRHIGIEHAESAWHVKVRVQIIIVT